MTPTRSIYVNQSQCAATEFCERIAPELFKVGTDGVAHVQGRLDTRELEGLAEEAEMACPTGAITLEARADG